MRMLLLVLAVMFALNPVFAGGEKVSKCKSDRKLKYEQRRKEENAKCAAKYSDRAQKQLNSKLSKCYENAPAKVREAATKEVELQKKLGTIYQKISDAYKNGDKEAITALNDERWEIDCAMDLAHKKTKTARHLSPIEEKIKKLPKSQKLKDLNRELTELSEKYLNATKSLIAQKKEIKQLEKKMRKLDHEAHQAAREEWKKKSSCKKNKRKKCKPRKPCKPCK